MDASARSVQTLDAVFARIIYDPAYGILRINATQIGSGGRRGGGSYAGLTQGTKEKKGNSKILYTAGASPKYSRFNAQGKFDTLVKSVTVRGAPWQRVTYSRQGFQFGTRRPYAYVHQNGSTSRRIPARPFLKVLQSDADRWNAWIAEHLMLPFDTPVKPEAE
jgi:hypothetical protein